MEDIIKQLNETLSHKKLKVLEYQFKQMLLGKSYISKDTGCAVIDTMSLLSSTTDLFEILNNTFKEKEL